MTKFTAEQIAEVREIIRDEDEAKKIRTVADAIRYLEQHRGK